MKAKVSIIIPTFNEEKYLPKLLRSIDKQSCQPEEVIIVDAFSTDKTRQIAKKFGHKVLDGGLPAKARNIGAEHAKQPLLLFLDSDVILPKSFLEETIAEMEERELDIASCYISPMSTQKIDKVLHDFVNYYFKITKRFHPHIPGFCIFVKRRMHETIGGFDESVILAEDYDYVSRIKKVGKFSYLNSYKIPVSIRRLSEEGRLNVALKYLALELHLIFLGQVRKQIFTYKFGQHFKQ
jgi:glycosyltransferase involved in cell wall biosynthesis